MLVTNPTLPPKSGHIIIRTEDGNDHYEPISDSIKSILQEAVNEI